MALKRNNPNWINRFFSVSFLFIVALLFFRASPTLAAAVSWDSGGANNDWETAANWSGDAVPTDADDVTIDYAETININATTTINSLTVGGTNATVLNFDYDALTAGALIIDAGALTVAANGTITHTAGSTTSVLGSVYIDVQTGGATITGTINVDAKGYTEGYGTGVGGNNFSGGGFGGEGGRGESGTSGTTYGSITAPVSLGSGGNSYCGASSGHGAGAVRLHVAGELSVAGSISAVGGDGTAWCAGAGSGGSIYLDAGTISGAGTISVNGGADTNGELRGGHGGGGRVAMYYDTKTYSGGLTAYTGSFGSNTYYGGAGTIYVKDNAQPNGDLTIDNNSKDNTTSDTAIGKTNLSTATYKTLTISNDGHIDIQSGQTLTYTTLTWTGGNITDSGGTLNTVTTGDVVIPASSYFYANGNYTGASAWTTLLVNGVLTHSNNVNLATYDLDVETTSTAEIAAGGSIDVSGRGFTKGNGTGTGSGQGAAGGHGGQGGPGDGTGGGVYGSITAPITLGSGGNSSCGSGGQGGGAVKLTIGTTLTVTGDILASGSNASNDWCSAAGAGGSIYLDVTTMAGAGAMTAGGGNAVNGELRAGGGGGGRIAYYYDSSTYSGTVTAYGGYQASNYYIGAAGTIYEKDNDDANGDLKIDNNSHDNATYDAWLARTPLTPTSTPLSLTVDSLTLSNDGHLLLTADTTIDYTTISWTGGNITDRGGVMNDLLGSSVDMTIPTGSMFYADYARTLNSLTVDGTLTHSQNYSTATYRMNLTVTTDMTISASGSVTAYGKGFVGQQGNATGKGYSTNSGAGYGGQGYGVNTSYGNVYGSITAPTDLGSGGGSYIGWATDAKTLYGGGAIQLTVGGELDVSGSINVNAFTGSTIYCDGAGQGSGGSIYLDAGTLSGAGSMTANGGIPCHANGGGGGGGRIAIHYTTNSSTLVPTAYGGWITGGVRFGGAGTVYWNDKDGTDNLVIDNNSHDYTSSVIGYNRGRTVLTNSGTPASFTFDTVTISNSGDLLLNSDTTIISTTNTWTGGDITDQGGTWNSLLTNLVIPTGARFYADTTRSVTSVVVNGTMTHSLNSTAETYKIDFTTTGDFTIGATGTVNVDGYGFTGRYGTGAGVDAGTYGSGGGYGGRGGATSDGGDTGGATYGSATAPTNIGSGGSGNNGTTTGGKSGGGAIKLTVGGNLAVGGEITADGGTEMTFGNSWENWGGGSGGSVWLDIVGTLSGTANITADGSGGKTAGDGAGGGGRIYITCSADSHSGSMSVITGTVGIAGGGGTATLVLETPPTSPTISNPLSNSYNNSLTPTITGSTYVSDVAHVSTDWKVVASSDTCSSTAVWESEHDAVNLTSITVGVALTASTTYKACVRYTNSFGDSSWSTAITFTTQFGGTSNSTTWDFDEGVVADNYDFNDIYVELDASGNSLARLKDLGAGVYRGAQYPGYAKRKEITITNTTATELTNYQVKLNVLYDSDMQADFDDIRFASSDGSTSIDFWLESKTDSSKAIVWVEVPTIGASTTATIYMYYGNTSVSSASNGANTFDFFDDFESYAVDSNINGQGSWVASVIGGSGEAKVRSVNSRNHLRVSSTSTGSAIYNTLIGSKTVSSTLGYAIESYVSPAAVGECTTYFFGNTTTIGPDNVGPNDGHGAFWIGNGGTPWSWVRSHVSGVRVDGTYNKGDTASVGTYYRYTFKWLGTSLNALKDGKATFSTTSSAFSGFTNIWVGTYNPASWNHDWILVRKITSSDPAIAWGNEASTVLLDWNYRQAFSVFNETASELTNFQVKINVPYNSSMQTDFDDVRFASSDGTTLLDYWLETKTDSSVATFWVEIPTIGASSSTNIYLYYGNSGASSVSNGTNTFDFFDDFSGDLSKWTAIGSFDTTGGTLNFVSGASCSSSFCFLLADTASMFSDYVMDYSMYYAPALDNGAIHRSQSKVNADNTYATIKRHVPNNHYFHRRVATAWGAAINELAYTYTDNVWMYMQETFAGSTLSTRFFSDQARTNLATYNSWTEASWGTGYVGIYNYSTSTGVKWDDFRIRKYAATEPTVVPGGVESVASFDEISVAPSTAGTHPIYNELYGLGATTGTVEGSIGYTVSNNGTNWYYHNGSAWVAVTTETSQYNTLAQVDAYLYDFTSEIGDGEFYFKAFLISDTTQEVELNSLTLTYIGMPTVNWTTASQSGAEDAGGLTVTASLSFSYALDVTIPYTVTGTATGSGTDYSITASPLVVTAGSTTGNVTITVTNDVIDELDETVVVTMGSLTNGIKGATDVHTATITDNDAAPTIAVADVSVAENAGPGTVTVTMTGGSYLGTSVNYATSDGTALDGTDYTATSGTLTWAADATGDKTFTITLSDDTLDEDDETVTITLSVPVNATISDTTGALTITDNDDPPTITFDSNTASGSEATSPAAFNVSLSAASGRTITATCATHAITATAGTDYTAISSTLTFSPGDTSKTVNITISNDALDENNETFSLHLNDYSNVTAGTYTADTYTITDNDDPPTVSWTTSSQSVTEDATTATITAELSAASGLTVTIPYTMTGTATGSSTDYTITASPVTISAGSTTTDVTVTIIEDAVVETDETVITTIGSPTNASTGATTVHTLTIANDDRRSKPTPSTGDTTPSTINLTSPTDNEQLIAGSFKTITWSSTGTFGFVNLAYSTDGGVSYQTIEDNLVNSGSYYWSIPNQSVTNGFIRIEGTDLASILTSDIIPFTTFVTTTPIDEETPAEEIPTEEEAAEQISLIGMALESVLGDRWINEAEKNGVWEIFPDLPEEVSIGTLVKLPDDGDPTTQFDSAVYYIGLDKRRHAFPNEQVYKSWFSTFYGIKTIDSVTMSNIPLGPMVTYRPGSTLIKFPSITKVYSIDSEGCLRWLTSEELAIDMYGPDWARIVKDVSEAFWSSYCFGDDLVAANDQDWDTVIASQ
ncbi:MAG: DUF2341 domain-containing protein [Patescibacteria group bacterium]|jgi:hypothetical protein